MKRINYIKALLVIFSLSLFQNAYSFYIVGYLTTWAGNVNNIPYEKYTHINYAFVTPNSSGSGALDPLGTTATTKLTTLVSLAHAKNTKVCISVGGAGVTTGFEILSANSSKRTTFVVNLLNFISTYNLDGVDLDWEFPSTSSAANYTLLIGELSDSLHLRGKILTAAVASRGPNADVVDTEVFDYVDFLNLMAYDAGTPHSPYSEAATSVQYWQGRELPLEKTVLGVPFYGKSGSSSKTYSSIVSLDNLAPYKDLSNGYNYNGIQTMKNKTNLAKDNCAGIMIWEVSGDTNDETSLLAAIRSQLPGLLGLGQTHSETNEFLIFPNPSIEDITLRYTATNSADLSISISNLLGKELIKFSIPQFQGNLEEKVNISSLLPGVYLINLQSGEKIMTQKLTVRK